MTQEEIVAFIRSGDLFGVVEVDIHVPDHLKPYFSEFCPIFKNVEVGREDIGDLMKEFAKENKFLTQPRRTLIGSFHATKMMMITPLLRWYLERGLVITKVYQVIQYKSSACFRNFMEQVTDARRAADKDPNQSILASAFKLLVSTIFLSVFLKRRSVVYALHAAGVHFHTHTHPHPPTHPHPHTYAHVV